MKMQCLVFIVLLSLTCNTYGRADIDYDCPSPYCQCATLPDRLDAVQLVCQPPIIRDDFFNISSIPAKYTTWLTIICKMDTFVGHFPDRAFSHLQQLDELSIINCVAPTIPSNVFEGLKALKHLNITRKDENQTPTIPGPGFLDPLENLQILEIPMAKMEHFSDGFLCKLRNLEHVELARNHKTVLNGLKCATDFSEGPALPKVKFLNLNSNGLEEITLKFRDVVPNVEVLGLAANKITGLSRKSFADLRSLKRLYLELNPIGKLPSDMFRDLTSLELLNLESTELSTLNAQIFQNNSQLRLLILSDNRLHDITLVDQDSEILKGIQNLLYLDISSNNIINIPDFLSNTSNLLHLIIGGNQITEISSHVFQNLAMLQTLNLTRNPLDQTGLSNKSLSGLRQLNTLDLSYCKLTAIPDGFFEETGALTNLYLSGNELTHLPTGLNTLGNLHLLDLSWNRVSQIETDNFDRMHSLISLNLNHNLITYLPKSFLNKNPNIQEIYFENNEIGEIEYGAFDDLDNLKILDLSKNNLKDITLVLYFLSKLEIVFLSENKLRSISKWCFPPSTNILSLQFNQIYDIEMDTFSEMQNLRAVYLEHNRLRFFFQSSIQVSPLLISRPQFYLAGNSIECNCQMSWILDINTYNPVPPLPTVPDLHRLRCALEEEARDVRWVVEMFRDEYLCQWETECDQFSCDCCFDDNCSCKYVCPSNCTCHRNREKSLQIVDCANGNLTTIPDIPPIVTHARLDGNNFEVIQTLAFRRNSKLKVLSLNNSNIKVIKDGAFKGLKSLHTFRLENNRLENITTGMFSGLDTMRNLSLHGNTITTLSFDGFNDMESLKSLTLHNNQLVEIPRESFVLKTTTITLSGNPWACNCRFGPYFQKWIQTNVQNVVDANEIKCEYGANDKYVENSENLDGEFNNTVELIHMDFSRCFPNTSRVIHKPYEKKSTIIGLSVSGCVFLLVLTIALLLYISREIIKVCLYNRYGFRFNKKDEKNDGKRFDAYVSYSKKDQHFVTKSLVPKLEKESPHYHLCLHYRDWPIGGSIAQTICESVEKSRRTIILLSSNFMESEWCQYEFKAAHYRVLHDKTIRLIIVLVDDKPPPNLDPELKLYIKTHKYLEWKDPWFWEKLRYALPDVQREPRPSGAAYYRYLAGKPVLPDPENGEGSDGSDPENGAVSDPENSAVSDGSDEEKDAESSREGTSVTDNDESEKEINQLSDHESVHLRT